MKRLSCILIAALCLALFAACEGSSAGSEPSRELSEATRIDPGEKSPSAEEVEEEEPSEPEPELPPLKQPETTPEEAEAMLAAGEAGVVPIANAKDMMALSALVNDGNEAYRSLRYELQRNISMEGYDFIPIGTPEHPFQGTFEGGGFIVSKLSVRENAHEEGAGLFGCVGAGGRVQNLHLTGGDITGRTGVGGVAGVCRGELFNCSFNGSVTGINWVGGLVGALQSDEEPVSGGTAASCFINADVSGTGLVGGLAGYVGAACTVGDSYALGSVTSIADEAGSDSAYIGGFVGFNNTGAIVRCFSHNEVYTKISSILVGGFLGSNDGTVADCYFNGTSTENWKPVGSEKAVSEEESEGAGESASGDVSSEAGGTIPEEENSLAGVTPCTVAELVEQETYQNWDFTAVWEIDGVHNRGLPFLRAAELY